MDWLLISGLKNEIRGKNLPYCGGSMPICLYHIKAEEIETPYSVF